MTDEATIWSALCAAQAEFPTIEKGKQGKITGTSKAGKFYEYTYKYADLADILKTILPILSKHNLALVQSTQVDNGVMLLDTKVIHSSGEKIDCIYPVCSVSGEHQKMGAALTYARRYALSSLLSISVDEDVDGAGAATIDNSPQPRSENPAPVQTDERTPMQKASALVNWLPDCKSMVTFQEAEAKAKAELKPVLDDKDWLRLEAELNTAFHRLAATQDEKEAA